MLTLILRIATSLMMLSYLAGCDKNPADGALADANTDNNHLQPIAKIAQFNAGGQGCTQPVVSGQANLENNFGLDTFCMDYSDMGDGTIEFSFVKTSENSDVGRM